MARVLAGTRQDPLRRFPPEVAELIRDLEPRDYRAFSPSGLAMRRHLAVHGRYPDIYFRERPGILVPLRYTRCLTCGKRTEAIFTVLHGELCPWFPPMWSMHCVDCDYAYHS